MLNPQWLTKLMATLITTKPNFVREGVWTLDSVKQVWKPPELPDALHRRLLRIFELFELVLPIGPEKWLIPTLLPEKRPSLEWSHRVIDLQQIPISRIYRFDFPPMGFFSRLMIRIMHSFQGKAYWRNGLFVTSDGAEAIFQYIAEVPCMLLIEVKGPKQVAMFRQILEATDSLISGWYAIAVERLVPCQCDACKKIAGVAEHHLYTLYECETACIRDSSLVCKSEHKQNAAQLAPDLVLGDFKELDVNPRDFEIGKQLGQGSFGTIFQATYKGKPAAVKKLDSDGAVEIYREFRREVWLSSTLRHPAIVQLFGACLNPLCMVMELASCGDLFNLLHGPKLLEMNVKIRMAMNIADGTNFLHSRKPPIIHRDLRSPNILVASLNPEQVMCKISDFGESRMVASTMLGRENLGITTPHAHAHTRTHVIHVLTSTANPCWLAPEIMQNQEYSEKADIFSLGIIMWELLTRETPYDEHEVSKSSFSYRFEDAIIGGLRPTIPSTAPPEWRQLIEDCWQHDQHARPAASAVYVTLQRIVNRFTK